MTIVAFAWAWMASVLLTAVVITLAFTISNSFMNKLLDLKSTTIVMMILCPILNSLAGISIMIVIFFKIIIILFTKRFWKTIYFQIRNLKFKEFKNAINTIKAIAFKSK